MCSWGIVTEVTAKFSVHYRINQLWNEECFVSILNLALLLQWMEETCWKSITKSQWPYKDFHHSCNQSHWTVREAFVRPLTFLKTSNTRFKTSLHITGLSFSTWTLDMDIHTSLWQSSARILLVRTSICYNSGKSIFYYFCHIWIWCKLSLFYITYNFHYQKSILTKN